MGTGQTVTEILPKSLQDTTCAEALAQGSVEAKILNTKNQPVTKYKHGYHPVRTHTRSLDHSTCKMSSCQTKQWAKSGRGGKTNKLSFVLWAQTFLAIITGMRRTSKEEVEQANRNAPKQQPPSNHLATHSAEKQTVFRVAAAARHYGAIDGRHAGARGLKAAMRACKVLQSSRVPQVATSMHPACFYSFGGSAACGEEPAFG